MGFFTKLFGDKQKQDSFVSDIYSTLTYREKLAAMNLMKVFGGSCSGTSQELNKIDHIMSVEGRKMGISGLELNAEYNTFSDLKEMVRALRGANRNALRNLFWPFYCIIAVGKSTQAVQLLLGIYNELGFTTQECATILEQKTGVNICGL